MNITLDTKLEYLIQQQITSGKYSSINDVIEEALSLLEKRNQYDQSVEKNEQKIDVATAQLDRVEGTYIDKENNFWEALQECRKIMESENIVFTDDDFANLRDKSTGREVNL
jgi:antitoxin ParD1/3/4